MSHEELKDPATIGLPDPPAGHHWLIDVHTNKVLNNTIIIISLHAPDGAASYGQARLAGKNTSPADALEEIRQAATKIKNEHETAKLLQNLGGAYGYPDNEEEDQ